MPLPTGELQGVRSTRDELVAQETQGKTGEARRRAIERVDRAIRVYDYNVRNGLEPEPRRRD